MSEELELQDTPEVDVDAAVDDPAAEGQTDQEPAKPEEPYLAVNDRTVYKTREDAVRGYNEAASRIAQLSGWEKQAKAYGLSDPRQLDAVAQELRELRKFKEDAAKQISQPKQDQNADPKLKESEQVKKYLRENGFITKEEQAEALKELREQLDEMRQQGSRSEEMRFQNQEAEARNDLNGYLSAAGIKDDANGSKAMVVGTLVKDWINNSEERIEQWSKGGMSAKNLIKEGTEFAINMLGWKQAPAAPGALKPTDPGYAAAKAKAVATNKKLPAPGTGRAHGDGSKPNVKKTGITTKTHDRAWEVFQSGGTE